METGCYRSTDKALSTSDWISLNFDEVPTEVISELYSETHTYGDRKSDNYEERNLRRLDARCERCGGDGEVLEGVDGPDPDGPCPVCDGTGEDPEQRDLYGWPFAHGTGYRAENRPEVKDRLIASGFVVYEAEGGPFDGELIFGVDGGGYSFHGAHWIPLRVRCGLATFAPMPERLGQREPSNGVDPQYRAKARAFIARMRADAAREGDERRIDGMPEVVALSKRAKHLLKDGEETKP